MLCNFKEESNIIAEQVIDLCTEQLKLSNLFVRHLLRPELKNVTPLLLLSRFCIVSLYN